MPRGGKRKGAGRPVGSRSRPRLQLKAVEQTDERKPTAAQRMAKLRRSVALLVADGMAPEKIAAVLGFDLEKLKAVFAHELEHGREIVRAEVLLRFDAAGDGGSVPANRSLESISAAPGAPAAPPEQRAPSRLGKKAAAQLGSKSAFSNTIWDDFNPDRQKEN